MKKTRRVYMLGCAFLICTVISTAGAAIIPVEDVQLTFAAAPFYNAGSDYFYMTNATTTVGILRIQGAATYDYTISGKATVTSCALIQDLSAGGRVKGDFAGGATITVKGTLKDSLGNVYGDSSTILLEAVMVPTSAQTWTLDMVSLPVTTVTGGVACNPTTANGGLGAGIALGGNTLRMGMFNANFSFQNAKAGGSTPTSFLGPSSNIGGMPASVQLTAIPEPVSMLLLALGGFGILRRRR